MRRVLTRTATPATALVAALALTGCGAGDQATFQEPAPAAQAPADAPPDAGGATAAPGDDTGTTAEPTGASGEGTTDGGGLTPIGWPDAPRELSEVEQEFMHEPGPFAGDAFDEDAVVEAVLALEPETAQEWQLAIQRQLQGDYAEDLKASITFDPTLGETADGPTEQSPDGVAVGSNHFALVLDASGSMDESSASGTRMAEAKEALTGFVGSLPEGSTVSLRVYGHGGDNTDAGKQESCNSSEEIYSGPVGDGGFDQALDSVDPTGWTPLATAIEDAAGDIPQDATDGIVYVVTDGIETCGGDPVAAAGALAESGIKPIVNVIGFQAGDSDQEALRAIAEAGGGEYTQADSKADLEEYWDEEYSRMMAAWDEWKSAELDRIEAEGSAKLDTAQEVGARLMDEVDEEGRRELDVTDRLREEDHLDYDTGLDVWNYFYGRKLDMWNYAYGVKLANWNAAYGIKIEAWNDVYATGTSKWSEYYEKKVGN